MTKALDLGCGPTPKNTFNADEIFGMDVRDDIDNNIKRADLSVEAIPYEWHSSKPVGTFYSAVRRWRSNS